MRLIGFFISMLLTQAALSSSNADARVLFANPESYRELVKNLKPGDTLLLDAGIYEKGLTIHHLEGSENQPIIIEGPREGGKAIFYAREGANTVSIVDSSFVTIRNLELDGRGFPVDAVKGEGHANFAHHIILENLYIYGHGASQQIVGISTKCTAWNWVIRGNIIIGAGTGIYLGNSDGNDPFIHGLIEHNLIANTLGYNIQIKHQLSRPERPGIPKEPGTTIIRHNVFSKAENASTETPRPNLLVGHFPSEGTGSEDIYQIYGNFFYQNPTESLFQGTGNVALYNNLFVNSYGHGIAIQKQHEPPRSIYIFYNTVLARSAGIILRGGLPGYPQLVLGNAVFAAVPIDAQWQEANVTGTLYQALDFLNQPLGTLESLDLSPRSDQLRGNPVVFDAFEVFLDWNRDFEGNPRDGTYRGAYEGGYKPAWHLSLERKPLPVAVSFHS